MAVGAGNAYTVELNLSPSPESPVSLPTHAVRARERFSGTVSASRVQQGKDLED